MSIRLLARARHENYPEKPEKYVKKMVPVIMYFCIDINWNGRDKSKNNNRENPQTFMKTSKV